MNLSICKKICKECPFSQSSPKGWLGPHSLEAVIETQQQGKLFSCHMVRKQDMVHQDIECGDIRICRGFIASATKSGIVFDRETETHRALSDLQILVSSEAKESFDSILSCNEFVTHHSTASCKPRNKLPEKEIYQRLGYKFKNDVG
ncbi:hypothetical protein MNBD_GAMMA22-36 [hydrothermal vent metagenome]|uniref:Uncharacterized protein n=1 Tax=hydrothermal vent metagenome TaxID=652676 RepID=A0A3B1A6V5_9ZZZZ